MFNIGVQLIIQSLLSYTCIYRPCYRISLYGMNGTLLIPTYKGVLDQSNSYITSVTEPLCMEWVGMDSNMKVPVQLTELLPIFLHYSFTDPFCVKCVGEDSNMKSSLTHQSSSSSPTMMITSPALNVSSSSLSASQS